jgi:hypothetical protein
MPNGVLPNIGSATLDGLNTEWSSVGGDFLWQDLNRNSDNPLSGGDIKQWRAAQNGGDVYYLGLVDVDLARLQAANASTTQEEVVKLVANMTQNAQAAFTYDPSNNLPLLYLYNIYKMVGLKDQEELVLKELSNRLPQDKDIAEALKAIESAKASNTTSAQTNTDTTKK